jgi:ATP-binding cassette subfamily E protein 1
MTLSDSTQIKISEQICKACLLRINKTPNNAVKNYKIPNDIKNNLTYKYGPNKFRLSGLCEPKIGKIVGILGQNGIGKSTCLQILSGKILPNFGNIELDPNWSQIIKYYRGSSLQNYFNLLSTNQLKIEIKKQTLTCLDEFYNYTINDLVEYFNFKNFFINDYMELYNLRNRKINLLSGGELQRLLIMISYSRQADVYIFDEPTNFLDLRQKIRFVELINNLSSFKNYIIVIDHDLSILESISEYIYCLFGITGAFGIFTPPIGPKEAINQFIEGYFPSLNIKSRPESLKFNWNYNSILDMDKYILNIHKDCLKVNSQNSNFTLNIPNFKIFNQRVYGLLGQNGSGKSLFINWLNKTFPYMTFLKNQFNHHLINDNNINISQLLELQLGNLIVDDFFKNKIIKPFCIERYYQNKIYELSGGQIQIISIIISLGQSSQILLLDEPSSGIDCEQRIIFTQVIKNWISFYNNRSILIIDHDLFVISTICNQIILFKGDPGSESKIEEPQSTLVGIENFLLDLKITIRRDHNNNRIRINKQKIKI